MNVLRFYLGSRDVWVAFAWCFGIIALFVGLAVLLPRSQPEPTRHGECPCVGYRLSPEEGQ